MADPTADDLLLVLENIHAKVYQRRSRWTGGARTTLKVIAKSRKRIGGGRNGLQDGIAAGEVTVGSKGLGGRRRPNGELNCRGVCKVFCGGGKLQTCGSRGIGACSELNFDAVSRRHEYAIATIGKIQVRCSDRHRYRKVLVGLIL